MGLATVAVGEAGAPGLDDGRSDTGGISGDGQGGLTEEEAREAAAPKRDIDTFDLKISSSIQWDENVTLEATSDAQPTDQRDWKSLHTLSLKWTPYQGDSWRAGARYGFFQSFHFDLGLYDIQSHTGSVFATLSAQPWMFSFPVSYTHYSLDEDRYLETAAFSPTAFVVERDNLMGIFQLRAKSMDYATEIESSISQDGTEFAAVLQQWLLLGDDRDMRLEGMYQYNCEITRGDDYEYDGHLLGIGGFAPIGWEMDLDVDLTYQMKRYRHIYSGADVERDDNKLSFVVKLRKYLNENISVEMRYATIDNQSNIDLKEYSRNVYGLGLTAEF